MVETQYESEIEMEFAFPPTSFYVFDKVHRGLDQDLDQNAYWRGPFFNKPLINFRFQFQPSTIFVWLRMTD